MKYIIRRIWESGVKSTEPTSLPEITLLRWKMVMSPRRSVSLSSLGRSPLNHYWRKGASENLQCGRTAWFQWLELGSCSSNATLPARSPKTVELVWWRWFPSHHILHPENIFENYQSMSFVLALISTHKNTPTIQRIVSWPCLIILQAPEKKRNNFHYHHHQHRGTFAFQQFVLQIRRSIIRFDHFFGTLP